MDKLDRMLAEMRKAMNPEPLVVLAKTPTGEEVEMTVDELLTGKCTMIRVAGGDNLTDLDKLLDAIREAAGTRQKGMENGQTIRNEESDRDAEAVR